MSITEGEKRVVRPAPWLHPALFFLVMSIGPNFTPFNYINAQILFFEYMEGFQN